MSRIVSLITLTASLALISWAAANAPQSSAAPSTAGLALERVGSFDRPLLITQPPGKGPLMVVEQSGRIRVQTKAGGSWPTFLHLPEKISCCGEQGLLGLAFHPDYQRNRRFYVNYTDTAGDTRVVEYRRAKGSQLRAKPSTARQLLKIPQPYANHNGGAMAFDRAGRLYIATGDGGSGGDPHGYAQSKRSLLGKILRIDPLPVRRGKRTVRPYSIPASNPYAGKVAGRNEIFALGLRNPWRFSLDYASAARPRIAIGDVGQGSWEEVNYLPLSEAAGANFGWARHEGPSVYDPSRQAPGAITPIFAYPHEGTCSITGGYVATDRDVPALAGRYVYGDFCSGEIRSLIPELGGARDDASTGLTVPQLSSFGTDRGGRLYAVSLAGPVYRIGQRTPGRLQVREQEFSITLSRSSLPAGAAIVELVNRGEDPHDLYMQRTGPPEEPISFDELEPGGIASRELTLEPGDWQLWCNLEGHRAIGMEATLRVNE